MYYGVTVSDEMRQNPERALKSVYTTRNIRGAVGAVLPEARTANSHCCCLRPLHRDEGIDKFGSMSRSAVCQSHG